jgi:F420-dependent oxidoreductase-like protein
MKIAVGLDIASSVDVTIERARTLRNEGFNSMWASQIFGPDTLTVLAIVGRELPDIDLGTAVVPVQPRHPMMLAAQARTVQEAIGGRLTLGIGLSHQMVVEQMWGLSFERPASYMRDYLAALAPLLRGESVATDGERIAVHAQGPIGPKDVRVPGLLIAALGTVMLEMAGTYADGTLLWMTGRQTIETHVTPTINAAAAAARRAAPRIVCSLPIGVTNDVAASRAFVNDKLSVYGTLPSYRAMLDREGAAGPGDVGIFGTSDQVLEELTALRDAGVTEFSAVPFGDAGQRDELFSLLRTFAASEAAA